MMTQMADEWKTAWSSKRVLQLLEQNAAAAFEEPALRGDDSDSELVGGTGSRYRVKVAAGMPRMVVKLVGVQASEPALLLLGPVIGKVCARILRMPHCCFMRVVVLCRSHPHLQSFLLKPRPRPRSLAFWSTLCRSTALGNLG